MTSIKDSILIEASPEKVYDLAADPHKWSSWFVGLGDAESVEGDNAPGMIVKHSYLMSGMRFPVTTTVIDSRKEDDGAYFWKGKNEGSLAGWLSWTYAPKEGKTLVTAEMEYTVPGSVLGKVADRLFVERNQERAMRHTLENLKQLAEG